MGAYKVIDFKGNVYRVVEPQNYIQELFNPYNKGDYFGYILSGEFKTSKKLIKNSPTVVWK